MRVFLAQAFATDSGDESPWIYYRWLLGNSLAHLRQAQQQAQQQQAGGPGSSSDADDRLEDARAVLGEVSQAAAAGAVKVSACCLGMHMQARLSDRCVQVLQARP